VGRSRAAVSNLLRLMDLHADVQALLRDNKLSPGHAKVLLAVATERQLPLARQIIEQQLSVRETERLVETQPKKDAAKPKPASAASQDSELSERLGLPVQLKKNSRGRGRIIVSFRNQAELDRLLARLGQA
jgi:ParB family chromosome partitioning protein